MTQGQGMEPTLAELVAQSRVAAAEAITELAELQAEVQQLGVEARTAREEAEAERAEKARAGELGPEQRRLQERIDLGQTSWGAVLSGADQSPEADAVWTSFATNAEVFTAELETGLAGERDAGQPDPREELVATFAELRAQVAAMLVQNEENSRGQ